jgi:hypothetical protein
MTIIEKEMYDALVKIWDLGYDVPTCDAKMEIDRIEGR